jgi:predicted hydrocarbon binding protein
LADLARDDFLVARDETGVLRDRVTNARVLVLSTSAYRTMCDELFEQFQSGAGVILYRMGEGYARDLTNLLPKLGATPEEVLRGLKRLGYLGGWGKFNFEVQPGNEDSVDCMVEKSAFLLRREDAGLVTCYFLSGILGTVVGQIFSKKFVAREIRCVSAGAPLCEFRIRSEIRKA